MDSENLCVHTEEEMVHTGACQIAQAGVFPSQLFETLSAWHITSEASSLLV